jgi:hypothetical protein
MSANKWFAVSIISLLVYFAAVIYTAYQPHDTTDPEGGRSGMRLYTDTATGCQYLGTWGGLTPRMDEQGKQICGRR